MRTIGLLNYKGTFAVIKFDHKRIIVKKLSFRTALKIALSDQFVFVFPNIIEEVLNENSDKYLSDKVELDIEPNSEFQIFISNPSNWKSTKVKIISWDKSVTLWTQEPDKYFESLYPLFAHKITRG